MLTCGDLRQVAQKRHGGGGGEIRTHGSFKASTVFKTAAFNRSATPPLGEVHFIRFLSKSVTIEENYLIFKNDEII